MENLRGILFMVASMAAFAVEDAFLKAAAVSVPVGQLVLINCLFGTLVFGIVCKLQGRPLFARGAWGGMALVRNLSEVVSTLGYVTALALIPLSLAAAIIQATPLMMTGFAALFLGEIVGWRRWSAITLGMIGVLVILRPGTEGFQIEALWAILSAFGLTAREIATRRVPSHIGGMQLAFSACVCLSVLGAGMLIVEGGPVMPALPQALMIAGVVATGTIGYGMVIAAARVGEVAVVTPFRYTRLLFALIIGALVFGERPDAPMLIGAGLIIASGIYTIVRERKRRKVLAQTAASHPSPAQSAALDSQ